MQAVMTRSARRLTLLRLSRFASSLRPLQPRGKASDSCPTVYVTGFLTDTRDHENYTDWLGSHQRLSRALGWCEEAHGVEWRTGSDGDLFGKWPLPVHVAVMMMRRSSPAAFAYGLAGDAILNAARVFMSFRTAETAAGHDAPQLAAALAALADAPHVSSYRVVAHSLGCRLVIDALPLLSPERRPAEVHLCAAATTPTHAMPKLGALCQPGGRLYHHWSAGDEALSSAFLLASGGVPALGSAPLPCIDTATAASKATTSASSHDASAYLGLASHGAFRLHFDRLASDAVLGREPPPPRPWLAYQQARSAELLTRALQRLPTVESFTLTQSRASLRVWARAQFDRRRQSANVERDRQ